MLFVMCDSPMNDHRLKAVVSSWMKRPGARRCAESGSGTGGTEGSKGRKEEGPFHASANDFSFSITL
jgi:hypothetical protein